MAERLLQKYEGNPIITPADMPKEVLYTFNPGAIKHNGEYIMIMDATGLDDIHRLWLARSKDGIHFVPEEKPLPMPPKDPFHPEVHTYDPRITKFGDVYYIMYASDMGNNMARLGLLKTKDFVTFERVATASDLGNRNGALFPEKIDGLYCRFDRPFGSEQDASAMWMSFSPDLVFWGKARPLMYEGKPFIDGFKMGAGAVPIRTEKGWLEIYHTVSTTCNGFIYRLKAMLLDLEKPWEVLGHTDFILYPEHDYEMRGRVSNVVFACNAIPEEDGSVKIYYGAADTNIGLAIGNINRLTEACLQKEEA